MPVDYFGGLDLGQTSDYTALAVLECTTPERDPDQPRIDQLIASGHMRPPDGYVPPQDRPPASTERTYTLRVLERFPLGTSYLKIVESVVEMYGAEPLAGSVLAVDATGIGRPVLDVFRKARPRCRLKPITITAGNAATPDGAGWTVPKKDLVGALQVLLQSRRLKVSKALPHAALLVKEMEAFRVKVNIATAHESFEALREGDHDDMVLAVGMAAWVGERGRQKASIRVV
jgi:hypothetical protein